MSPINTYKKSCLVCSKSFEVSSPRNSVQSFCTKDCTMIFRDAIPEVKEEEIMLVILGHEMRYITPTPCNSPMNRLRKYSNFILEKKID